MSDEEIVTARAAVVTAGVVTNVILVANPPREDEDPFELPDSDIVLLSEDSEVGVGWLYDPAQMEFTSPPDE